MLNHKKPIFSNLGSVVGGAQKKWPSAIKEVLLNRKLNTLHYIMRHIDRLLIINHLLTDNLPLEVRLHCQVIQFSTTELILGASSAVWLTRLRYLQPQLLTALREHPQFIHLTKISLRIHPISLLPPPITPQPRTLSAPNCLLLKNLSTTVSDLSLRHALLELSHQKKFANVHT